MLTPTHPSPRHSRRNTILLMSIVFGGFIVFGLSENIRGPALPDIQSDFSLTETHIGFLLALNALGYLLACSFTSALSNKIGIRSTGVLAFATMTLSGFMIYLSANFAAAAASFFLLYVGNGILEIGLGIMAARIFTKHTGAMMNLSHFFFGVGSTVAPIFGASLMGWNVMGGELGWRGMYMVMMLTALLPIIPALIAKFPRKQEHAEGQVSVRQLIREPIAWGISAVLTFGVVAELSIGSWLVYYLQNRYSWSLDDASRMLSVFFLLFMLSRLLLGMVTDKIGYTLSILILSGLAGVSSLAGVLLGEAGVLFLAVAGIGIAPVYPTVMALIAKRYARGTESAITFTVTTMGIGNVVGSFAVGWIFDVAGLVIGYSSIAISAIVASLICTWLYVVFRRRGELV